MNLNLPLGIGQIHAFRVLFRENPGLALIILLLLIALAYYLNSRR
ncbi:hypothetical protein WDC_1519 [Paucilactobacillus wasatchensis]|uniref:Uncharacterized protein n=1 Tax=Paucilactobacillus wasatchensis TaxID=1335616 RepID=A0A0D0Y3S4_9LACO|nr:hypothetical protein WDC_1519 [Paucilactobacillus wasatchensis]